MSFQEKRSIANIISNVIIFSVYFWYVYHHYLNDTPALIHDLSFWGMVFLIMIPVSIAVRIVALILFNIYYRITANEDGPQFSDERDKLIELKATKVTHLVFGLGFLVSMVSLVLDNPAWVMLIILIGSCFVSDIMGEITQLYYYRKGV